MVAVVTVSLFVFVVVSVFNFAEDLSDILRGIRGIYAPMTG